MSQGTDAERRIDAAARRRASEGRREQGIDIERSVASLFEARVAAAPRAIALDDGGAPISYDALNRLSNRIARALLAAGGEEGDRAVILLDSRPGAIAAMLGSLKALRAYVPLDPAFPAERIAFMCRDCRPRVVLTDSQYAARAKELTAGAVTVVNLDELDAALADTNLDLHGSQNTPAYILYTSGSTGQPKGVVQTQRNLLHFIRSYTSSLGVQRDDRLTLFYSYSFSAALMDIYGGLLTGATILPRAVKTHGIAGLADWLTEQRVSVYHSVPTVFRHLLETLKPGQVLDTIRVIDLGGEPVAARDIELFKEHFKPGTVIVNHLAATEASVMGQFFIDHDTAIEGPRVAVGSSADGVEIMILGDDLKPVAKGESGEIVARSEFLSPGYWDRPDLTAAAFLDDPDKPGRRLYRTGDVGRIAPSGLLEHLGRRDFRVKIRGLTIEVAEIESALTKAPSIRDARVIVRDFGGGDERLVAFVVPRDGVKVDPAALRQHVRGTLPDYMAPAVYVALDALPMTSTGKVDHKALMSAPFPSANASEASDMSRADATIESKLKAIWREMLKVTDVGDSDNFFELGGHSLLAMKMLGRVETEFNRRLMPNILAQRPTIRGLADALRADIDRGATMVVPLTTSGTRAPIFCIAPDHVLHFATLAKALGPDQPLFGVQPPFPDGFRIEGITVEHMAGVYAEKIDKTSPPGAVHLVGFCGGGVIAYEVAQVLLHRGRDVGVLALFDTPRTYENLRSHRIGPARYYARRALHHPRVAFDLPLRQGLSYLVNQALNVASAVSAKPGDNPDDPNGVSRETLDALAANRAAFGVYKPRPYPREIEVFLAADTFSIYRDDPRMGWRELASGGIRFHWIPGGHNGFLREPRIDIVKHHLESAIARCDAKRTMNSK